MTPVLRPRASRVRSLSPLSVVGVGRPRPALPPPSHPPGRRDLRRRPRRTRVAMRPARSPVAPCRWSAAVTINCDDAAALFLHRPASRARTVPPTAPRTAGPILEGLRLPFPVYEVGCLSACGMGTMISVNYENGDTILMDGLESALVALGIPPRRDRETAEDHMRSFGEEVVADDGASPSRVINVTDTVAPETSHVMVDGRDRDTTKDPTAGLDPQCTHTKNQFPEKTEGLRQIRDHVRKALDEENPDLLCLFLCDPFLTSFFKMSF